ncbi:MAG: hypothetical protein Q9M37_00185 [Desulfonauticus sp.]|nr:hypothetical protein [Desulfonauticus sp.]
MKRYFWLILIFVFLAGCSFSGKHNLIFKSSNYVKSAYQNRIQFVNSFLQGRFCDAKIYFNKSNLFFARADDLEMIGVNYYQLYLLYKYIGQEKIRFYKTANFYTKDKKLSGINRDKFYLRLIKSGDFTELWKVIQREKNPVYQSVYCRKIARVAPKEWKNKFLQRAFDIDKQYGWTIFLIEDWKEKKTLGSNSDADIHIKILQSSLENCEFDHDLYYLK